MSTFDENFVIAEDHPYVTKAGNLLAQFASRMLNPARLPTSHERDVLSRLQKDLKTSFNPVINSGVDDKGNLVLLERLWHAWFGPSILFQRVSSKWKSMGFQNRDPASDIRGGGRLSLECLVYLLERYPSVARRMVLKRKSRVRSRGEFANFPFACAGITLATRLCEVLLLSQPLTGKLCSDYEHTPATFWHVAGSRVAFLQLFVWAFVSLDSLWDETSASYLDFGRVMGLCVQRVTNVLNRLPVGVVPSAYSHSVEEFPGVVEPEPTYLLEGLENQQELDDDDDDDDDVYMLEVQNLQDEETETSNEVKAERAAIDELKKEGVGAVELLRGMSATEDLLGLSHLEADLFCNEPGSWSSTEVGASVKLKTGPELDFFGDFGLESS
eukprot:CAMPEP_0171625424 /NCGR_PEP_ID=MMETSP0990-20121206/19338_1 /TAXON_ID=483369 /ORGANISM="non described non described, Strain CCMP2098" /LENGTH=384 /DNA_ID=CAMNT_0012192425 /DNA_START=31 /DNA_END=1185 /DNA_ORIENTATION=-